MAYNKSWTPKTALDLTDKSIITQCAFKGAVDATARTDLTNPDAQQAFREVFAFLTEELFTAVNERTETTDDTPEVAGWTAADQSESQHEGIAGLLQAELGATPVENFDPAPPSPAATPGLTVRGTQTGPLPDWLFDAAKKAGVSEVYDNRGDLADNPKRPWFKGSKGQPLNAKGEPFAFWPPR